ncbi:MAG: TolC family protein [Bacteroidales bacterium]
MPIMGSANFTYKISVVCILFVFVLNPFLGYGQNAKYMKDTLPSTWIENELFEQNLPSNDKWWMEFKDPILEKLISKAVEGNYDLLLAANRIDMAKANMRISQSGFYPQVGLEASWKPQSQSIGLNPLAAAQRENQNGIASLGLSWEIDIIGSVRNRAKADKQLFKASESEYNAVMVSLCAEVASAYISLRTVQKQLSVAKENLESQKSVLTIVEARFKTGLVSKLDVAQASTVYHSTLAMIPELEAQILNAINSISILLGELPWSLRSELEIFVDLPNPNTKVAVGIPADIIRQRPDVSAAEKTILSRAATLGATKADWWPKFYIDASFGYGSNNFKNFVSKDNMMWQIGPTLRWNLFTGLQLNQATKVARESLDMSVTSYNQVIITALGEVDNAMNFYSKSIEQIKATKEAVDQSQLTLDLSLDLYTQGLADFQNVLDAQRFLLSYQNSYVASQGNSLQRLIQLYRALGGGWQVEIK